MTVRVLVDANIWFSRTLRDWVLLIHLENGPFSVYYTEDILAETVYHLRREHPGWPGGATTNIRDRIARVLEGGRVDDFVVVAPDALGDLHDGHVHAAALACDADILLTNDAEFLKVGEETSYDVYDADSFLCYVDDAAPALVRAVAVRQTEHFLALHGSADLCEKLRKAGCHDFAARVATHLQRHYA